MVAELRHTKDGWTVWYENETGIATPVGRYRNGVLVETLRVHGLTLVNGDRFISSHCPPVSLNEAREYARYLGADELRIAQKKRGRPAGQGRYLAGHSGAPVASQAPFDATP